MNPADYVERYAPVVRLFPYTNNPYLPCSVDWYLNSDQVALVLPDQSKVYQPPPGTSFDQTQLPTTSNSTAYLVDSDPTATSPLRSGDLSSAIAYVHILGPDQQTGYYDLQYWLFYAIRGLSTLRILLPDGKGDFQGDFVVPNGNSNGIGYQGAGEHQGDWKHVTVRIDGNGKLLAVFYAQHTGGFWCVPGQFTPTSTGGPIVYSARNTHSCFPAPGRANQLGQVYLLEIPFEGTITFSPLEETADGGEEWDCRQSYQIITNTDPIWNQFTGHWGPTEAQDVATGFTNAVSDAAVSFPYNELFKYGLDPVVAFFGEIFARDQTGPATPQQQPPWQAGDGSSFIPYGSYMLSSTDMKVTLTASCQKADGTYVQSSLDLTNLTPGLDIANVNGVLTDEKGAANQPSNQLCVPRGSYLQSSTKIQVVLSATCQKTDGTSVRGSLDITKLAVGQDIANINGVLSSG